MYVCMYLYCLVYSKDVTKRPPHAVLDEFNARRFGRSAFFRLKIKN